MYFAAVLVIFILTPTKQHLTSLSQFFLCRKTSISSNCWQPPWFSFFCHSRLRNHKKSIKSVTFWNDSLCVSSNSPVNFHFNADKTLFDEPFPVFFMRKNLHFFKQMVHQHLFFFLCLSSRGKLQEFVLPLSTRKSPNVIRTLTLFHSILTTSAS